MELSASNLVYHRQFQGFPGRRAQPQRKIYRFYPIRVLRLWESVSTANK